MYLMCILWYTIAVVSSIAYAMINGEKHMTETGFDPTQELADLVDGETMVTPETELSPVLQDALSVVPKKYNELAFSMMGALTSGSGIDWNNIEQIKDNIFFYAPWAALVGVYVYARSKDMENKESLAWSSLSAVATQAVVLFFENPHGFIRTGENVVRNIAHIIQMLSNLG